MVRIWNRYSGETIYESDALNIRDAFLEAVEKGVNLTEAYLPAVDLKGACLKGVICRRASFSGAILEGANLEDADLEGANLECTNLKHANLCGAMLARASLYNANLEGASLKAANLSFANLHKAQLKGAFIQDAKMEGANLEKAQLEGACIYSSSNADAVMQPYTNHSIYSLGTVEVEVLYGRKFWSGGTQASSIFIQSFKLHKNPGKRLMSNSLPEHHKDTGRILADRGQRYGSFQGHAAVSQALQKVVADGFANRGDDKTIEDMTPSQREALFMVLHKIARIVNGDFNYDDSWRDIAGYATLVVKELEEKNDQR